ncbi:MAG: TraR/DksA C4-type zinc finger protein [Candidatus Krumholzibacteriota bacterium]|nr:TraR/DksA C4-type zinc finger protein [Candidatus Krumholzibacteriota bacterium]
MPAKRKKTKLTKTELKTYREKLLAERERIIRELGRIEETINEETNLQDGSKRSYSNHLADLGTDFMEKEKNFYYASQEGHYLRSLDEALERMDRGTYGKCEACEDLISFKRLDAVPGARLCIACKSKAEKDMRGR